MRQFTPVLVVAGALVALVLVGDLATATPLQSGGGGFSGIADAIRSIVALLDSAVDVLQSVSNALSSLADALAGIGSG